MHAAINKCEKQKRCVRTIVNGDQLIVSAYPSIETNLCEFKQLYRAIYIRDISFLILWITLVYHLF